ncbi:hypothetical protein [Chondromyces crocatus]|uniref:Lipoprotein n=1 Tax=Chondromyces crocatus TaxID=52 RepID=A0A0K1EMX1_CHOCO|nr:hypothetical protein [Chondromyces crocatus]AKT42171.1 uncharacterized protein CMC5_063940 [Chondromyces crocatus]
MMHRAVRLLLIVTALSGCIVGEQEDDVGEFDAPIVAPNALSPNALTPNALTPNALTPNALTPNGVAGAVTTALLDPGPAGEMSRMFMRYAVSCAFTPEQTFRFAWTDLVDEIHDEEYRGDLGLAPEWQTGPLPLAGQEWVTACLAAKANHYGVSVLISLRNPAHTVLDVTTMELSDYRVREGAFWGNLFSSSPEIHSCYDETSIETSRSLKRVCAAGYSTPEGPAFCTGIQSAGSCAAACAADSDPTMGYTRCGSGDRVITTYLRD